MRRDEHVLKISLNVLKIIIISWERKSLNKEIAIVDLQTFEAKWFDQKCGGWDWTARATGERSANKLVKTPSYPHLISIIRYHKAKQLVNPSGLHPKTLICGAQSQVFDRKPVGGLGWRKTAKTLRVGGLSTSTLSTNHTHVNWLWYIIQKFILLLSKLAKSI